jgi:hypothetical protein
LFIFSAALAFTIYHCFYLMQLLLPLL